MFSIGLDFGSLFTKIASNKNGIIYYLNYENGDYSRSDIPNSIKYTQNDHTNPEIVLDILPDDYHKYFDPSKRSFYSDIRSLITTSKDQLDVVRDFIKLVMAQLNRQHEAFEPSQSRLGLAIPDEWYDDHNHPATKCLITVFEELGFQKNQIRFHRESICAAASLVHDLDENGNDLPSRPLNLLICDIGGSKTKLTLCEINQGKINIVKKDDNNLTSGKAFDEALFNQLERERLIKFPEGIIDQRFYLTLIEKCKRNIDDLLTMPLMKIKGSISNPDLKDSPIYTILYECLNIKHVWDAFEQIHVNLKTNLSDITQKCPIDRVFLTGGFSQHPLIRTTIKEMINPKVIINHDNPIHAISTGAALLTGGQVTLVETIDYTLTLSFHTMRNGRLETFPKKLISPENAGLDTETILNPPMIVNIKDNQEPIVMVKNQAEQEKNLCMDGPSQWPPPPGNYTLTMKINRHGEIFFLFKSTETIAFYDYKLSEQEAMPHDQ